MKIGEFFIQLGVSSDSRKLKDFIGDMGEMQMGAIANITSLTALTTELVKLGVEATNAAVGFEMFKNQTGLSAQDLQRWQIVAQQANVSAETVASGVTALQRSLADIRLGRGNIAPFQLLGISPTGNAFQVLDQIRNRIKGMDAATATNLVTQMGLSPEMMNVLRLSDKEFEHLSKTVHGMTDDQSEQFLRTKQSLVQLGMAFKYAGFEIVGHFLNAIERFQQYIGAVPGNMKGFIASLALLAAAMFPVQALLIGLLLLLDDLAVYFSGGQSMTGEAIKGLQQFAKELKSAFSVMDMSKLTGLLHLGTLGPAGLIGQGALGAAAGMRALTNNFNINVAGAGSAVDIANEVTRQITKHFSKSEQEFNNQGH